MSDYPHLRRLAELHACTCHEADGLPPCDICRLARALLAALDLVQTMEQQADPGLYAVDRDRLAALEKEADDE